MLLKLEESPGRRRRRRYTDEYKAELVAQSQQPHVSVAAIAQAHGINANLLRKWIREQDPAVASASRLDVTMIRAAPDFIELKPAAMTDPSLAPMHASSVRGQITVELPSSKGPVRLHWPAEHADRLAVCLKVLLT
ncbi:IS66-like element accessory protein TnpA [Kerstersia gyiorum]|uniref:IS66-like element accessory protein TnpA n=1 Tax=Kerstersia gyiorum TaxID=206506 RepID=UPI0039ED4638